MFIDDVESGKRGYVCIGCGQDMIAYNQGLSGRQHYFGHDPKDVVRKGQCTFSNETYRHKVAKDILQLIKEIRVPAVYVFPPDGSGQPRRIREARLVQAHSVGVEWVFFENPDGEISHCPKSDWTENRQTLSLNLTQQQSDSDAMLSRLTSELEATTRATEQQFLQQLSNEIAAEHPGWPDEFRNYLAQGDLYSLSNRKNAVAQACNELERGLKRELGATPYSPNQFIALMLQQTSQVGD